MDREQARTDHDNYWDAVITAAENVVENHRSDIENGNVDESDFEQLINEHCDQHDYVINVDLQIHTLLYSAHPCVGFDLGPRAKPTDEFPFGWFAGYAFERDVLEKAKDYLENTR